MSVEARLEAAAAEYQRLQDEFGVAVESRQKLEAQQSENEEVRKASDNGQLV